MAVPLDSDPASTTDQRVDAGGLLPSPERTARSSRSTSHSTKRGRRVPTVLIEKSQRLRAGLLHILAARRFHYLKTCDARHAAAYRLAWIRRRHAVINELIRARLTRSTLSPIEITGRREECPLQIILVDWLIIRGAEPDFKKYWKEAVPVEDRSLMVGEFLSEPTGHEKFPWVTEDLRNRDASRFINVGLWASAEAFHQQIARYFNPAAGKLSFEFELRRRALLTPACWRVGDWRLPIRDSGGVL